MTRKTWQHIVRDALLSAGMQEGSRGAYTADGWFYASHLYQGFYVVDSGEKVQVFTTYPETSEDDIHILKQCVEVLAKCDIDATYIAGTPAQGAHVDIVKLYDDRSETTRQIRALTGIE